MVNIKFNKYIGAIALGMALTTMPSCTDTWDEHYAEVTDPGASKTLWELICDKPELSNFKAIAEKARYYRDSEHPVPNYTYKDILNGNMVATAWVPENSSFQPGEFEAWMEKCEKSGYDVHLQLMSNHIALFRHQLMGDTTSNIKTINNKKMVFDRKGANFQGVPVNGKNISAVNGIMHTLKGIVPFKYNFYEYIKYGEGLDAIKKYVTDRDTTYFDEGRSIVGTTNENGLPEYVDSVYRTMNRMIERSTYYPADFEERKTWLMPERGFRAELMSEDSTFVMILPTDAAIAEAKEMLKDFYKYSPYYADESTSYQKKYVADDKMTVKNPDSVADQSMMMDILTPLVFNIHKQYNKANLSNKALTIEEFLDKTPAKYYYNTVGDTIRSIGDWDQMSLFADADTVKMSNGYGYIVNHWNFPPNYYKPNIYVEMSGSYNFFDTESTVEKNNTGVKIHNLINSNYEPLVEKYGRVSKNNFMYILPNAATDKPVINVKLMTNTGEAYKLGGEVMSGNYDIYMVRVPAWYLELGGMQDSLYIEKLLDVNGMDSTVIHTEMIDSLAKKGQNKLEIKVYNNTGQASGQPKASSAIKLDIALDKNDLEGNPYTVERLSKVDTILIAKDYNFPYTYKNIRTNKNEGGGDVKTYPYLEIKSNASPSEIKENKTTKAQYSNMFCIDQIILVSKETGKETSIVVNNTRKK